LRTDTGTAPSNPALAEDSRGCGVGMQSDGTADGPALPQAPTQERRTERLRGAFCAAVASFRYVRRTPIPDPDTRTTPHVCKWMRAG
jgi:hypothetical protein